ncbi:MAG: polymerase sigma-70 factor, subfamily, partial [Gammaproteobacteria bacterium]|nr:polymerase sigma-70 factor, subfamily [Gammaproteobacteria bacterium]
KSHNTADMVLSLAHFARLMKVCRRRGRSQEEAEDLIQEAFLRLHEYCRTTEVRNEEAFLARTVSNLAINAYRRGRLVSYASETVEELEQSTGIADSGPGPERIVAAQQRLDEITRVLGAVSERTCEVFLAHRAGYSYDEIATDLDISQRTVQKHIARAVFLLVRMKGEEQE